jgi:hypothetical protein
VGAEQTLAGASGSFCAQWAREQWSCSRTHLLHTRRTVTSHQEWLARGVHQQTKSIGTKTNNQLER